jgi:hypothetical protein
MEEGLFALRSAERVAWRAFRRAVRVSVRDGEASQNEQLVFHVAGRMKGPVTGDRAAQRPIRGGRLPLAFGHPGAKGSSQVEHRAARLRRRGEQGRPGCSDQG